MVIADVKLLLLCVLRTQRAPGPLVSLSLFGAHAFSVNVMNGVTAHLKANYMPFLVPLVLRMKFNCRTFVTNYVVTPATLNSVVTGSVIARILHHLNCHRALIKVAIVVKLVVTRFSLRSPTVTV